MVDVKKAYFYAPAKRRVFVEIPAEARLPGDGDVVGLLCRSLYGTRGAASNWAEAYTVVWEGLGFVKGSSSQCSFYCVKRKLRIAVHGDDFFV